MKKIISFVLISLLVLSITFIDYGFAKSEKEVSILFTHDMHSHLEPDKYNEDGTIKERGGFAKIKTLRDETLKKYPQTLLLDGGDFAMGTPFQTIFREKASELKMMAEVGFDITTLGNHEFDYRARGLAKMLNEAKNFKSQKEEAENQINKENPQNIGKSQNVNIDNKTKLTRESVNSVNSQRSEEENKEEVEKEESDTLPTLLASNINWKKSLGDKKLKADAKVLKDAFDNYGGKEYTILEKDGVRIGIIGLLGEEAIEDSPLSGLKFDNYIESAKKYVKILKDEKVDLIIALSHSGTNLEKWEESEDVKLAKEIPEIDLIISGHSHTTLDEAKKVGNTIIASCGAYNQNVGHIILEKDKEGWKLKGYKLIALDEKIKQDEVIAQIIENYKKDIDEIFFKSYGVSADKVIAKSDFDFKNISEIGMKQGEEPLGNLIADAYLEIANKHIKEGEQPFDLALTPSGTIRASFGKGDIDARNIFNVSSLGIGEDDKVGYPLVDVYLTGKELKTIAEVDASISDDKTAARIYTSGLSYTINRKRLFLNRAVDFAFVDKEGKKIGEVEDKKLYRVVGGLYTTQMLSLVKDNSFGLLSVEPKDEKGNVIKDFSKRIIKDEQGNELKEWKVLLDYMNNFGGQVPQYYAETHNRKNVNDTYSPLELLKQPNNIAIMALCIILIPIVIIVGIFIWLRKRRNARRGFSKSIFRDGGRYYKPSKVNRRKKFGKRRR